MTREHVARPVQAAALRPVRAQALTVLSRGVTGVLLLLAVWLGWLSLEEQRSDRVVTLTPAARPEGSAGGPGSTLSDIVRGIQAEVLAEGGRLRSLEMGRAVGLVAPVRLQVDLSTGDASEVDRLVTVAGEAGLLEAGPRAIAPTPSGATVDLEARVRLASSPRRAVAASGQPVAVELASVVERSGAELRRLLLPGDGREAIRIEASGDLTTLATTLEALETGPSAPLRFDHLVVRPATLGDGRDPMRFDLEVLFRLREPEGPDGAA